jgi:hypothetical protein
MILLSDRKTITETVLINLNNHLLETTISLPKGGPSLKERKTVIAPLTTVTSVAVGFIKKPIVPQPTQIAIRKIHLFTSLAKAKRGCAMNGTDRSYTVG